FVALDEIGPGYRRAVAYAHPLESDRRLVLRMQHAEFWPVIADGGVQFDRNADETEGDRPFPERARHKRNTENWRIGELVNSRIGELNSQTHQATNSHDCCLSSLSASSQSS